MKNWKIIKWLRRLIIHHKIYNIDIETQPLSGGRYIIGCDFANGKDHMTILKIVDGQIEIIKQT